MKLYKLRFFIQSVSFAVLTYGGRFGLRFGHFLPCFTCPYVGSCSGHCYLMALQGPHWGFQIPLAELTGMWGMRALGMFAGFFLLTILLSKTWCGWICPFGTFQDWISFLRKRLAISAFGETSQGERESHFPWSLKDKLKPVKYVLLVLLILIPVLIANAGFHPDFNFPFCQICPAKPLMPVFKGNFSYFAVDITNAVTAVMTICSIILAAFFLVGMFFKDRLFCMFCPMLALISIFDKIGAVRLRKKVDSCIGCGNCRRICPVDIRDVHLEREKENVLTQDCMECFKCVEACPQDKTLSARFLKWKLFSSSRDYVAKLFVHRA